MGKKVKMEYIPTPVTPPVKGEFIKDVYDGGYFVQLREYEKGSIEAGHAKNIYDVLKARALLEGKGVYNLVGNNAIRLKLEGTVPEELIEQQRKYIEMKQMQEEKEEEQVLTSDNEKEQEQASTRHI